MLRVSLCAALLCLLLACGEAPGTSPDAGFGPGPDAAADEDGGGSGDAGSADAAVAADAGRAVDAGSTAGDAGPRLCEPTPEQQTCGDGICGAGEYCCGGRDGACFADGAFCGAGGLAEIHCDDAADCEAGEICCFGENTAGGDHDAAYAARCATPRALPDNPCGTDPGGFAWAQLCECDDECGDFGGCRAGTAGEVAVRRCAL